MDMLLLVQVRVYNIRRHIGDIEQFLYAFTLEVESSSKEAHRGVRHAVADRDINIYCSGPLLGINHQMVDKFAGPANLPARYPKLDTIGIAVKVLLQKAKC